jgi:hypothetical protein
LSFSSTTTLVGLGDGEGSTFFFLTDFGFGTSSEELFPAAAFFFFLTDGGFAVPFESPTAGVLAFFFFFFTDLGFPRRSSSSSLIVCSGSSILLWSFGILFGYFQ